MVDQLAWLISQRGTKSQDPKLEACLPHGDVQKRLSLAELKMPTPDIFKEKAVIGEGTFGKVYRAKIND